MPPPHPVPALTTAVREAADVLRNAADAGKPCLPIRDRFTFGDIEAAYAVQRLNTEHALATGRRPAGRKIGLTSPAVQRQLGVAQPDFGALFTDMAIADGATVPAHRLLQPKIEAEVALVLTDDLPNPDSTAADVVRATGFAAAALEIVDSRIADWDITIVDTVADNASSGLFALGGTRVPLDRVDLRTVRMTLSRNGSVVSQGTGADCLGSPLAAARWLASTLARRGDPLRAGDIVLTGALGPMVPVAPGDVFHSEISGLGSVRVGFAPEGESR